MYICNCIPLNQDKIENLLEQGLKNKDIIKLYANQFSCKKCLKEIKEICEDYEIKERNFAYQNYFAFKCYSNITQEEMI